MHGRAFGAFEGEVPEGGEVRHVDFSTARKTAKSRDGTKRGFRGRAKESPSTVGVPGREVSGTQNRRL